MKLTTNYGLKKPEGSDVVNIDDFNYNADAIDTKLKAVETQSNTNKSNISSLQTQSNTNKSNISSLQTQVSENKASILAVQSELGTNKSTLENNINDIREVL